MKTVESNKTRKVKTVEVKHSNMTFVVKCHCHYMKDLLSPCWSRNRYTAEIKETGENIGMMGDRSLIRSQMNLINSKPHLFLK